MWIQKRRVCLVKGRYRPNTNINQRGKRMAQKKDRMAGKENTDKAETILQRLKMNWAKQIRGKNIMARTL